MVNPRSIYQVVFGYRDKMAVLVWNRQQDTQLSNGMSEYKIKTKVKEAGMFCLRKE
jgi:hypothetical protein